MQIKKSRIFFRVMPEINRNYQANSVLPAFDPVMIIISRKKVHIYLVNKQLNCALFAKSSMQLGWID